MILLWKTKQDPGTQEGDIKADDMFNGDEECPLQPDNAMLLGAVVRG